MENIKLISKFDELYVSSREVGENFGKKHFHVLETIDKIKNDSTIDISSLYIEAEYKASNGKINREILISERGLNLYLFNIQGYNEYKLLYINEFMKMKNYIEDLRFNKGDKKTSTSLYGYVV